MSRNKKILIVLGIGALAVIVLILGAVYFFTRHGNGGFASDIFGTSTPFDPFGPSGSVTQGSTSTNPKLPILTPNVQPIPILRRLSNVPVSSFVTSAYIQKTDNSYISFARFLERQTGHVFEVPLAFLSPAVKLSNTTVPRITESMWSPDGSHVLLRYMDDNNLTISTYLATLTYSTTSPENELLLSETTNATAMLEGSFLEENIPSVLFSPDGKKVLYVLNDDSGSRVYVKDLVKESTKLVLTAPFREITATWDELNAPLLYTKPSAMSAGLALRLDLAKNSADQILADTYDLTARSSPDGSRLIYFSLADGIPVVNQLTLRDQTISKVPMVTLPEKCTWSRLDANILYCGVPTQPLTRTYLESWYQGKLHTADQLWKINLDTDTVTMVVDPKVAVGEGIDMTNLMLSPKEDFALFIDKQDGILWSAKIGEPVYKAPSANITSTTSTSTTTTAP